ncbi:KDO2-lipid IV(A) lauroyltransferase [Cribrihabitans marinus]|uniref:KDO2-lipid IV(A) lauroyltransferase n=1 Tax=Cribrihabitans marinus TaxID=1227549 RepID=A0A1H6V413_9RHOB|nr:lysophospholipid acyltransferase family protein [Cribrihabitans marinus]GGH26377.1 lauroyl acyltransferase [Cribrihabitans marinus]SEI99261.1 KDO2-lipid IV(A) lauroyltransferase [Cribrihabitans marinus]
MPAEKSELSAPRRGLYFLTNLFMQTVLGAIKLLPYGPRVRFTGALASAVAPVVGFDKRVRANLALTCPELPRDEVRRLCRAVANNAGRAMMEHLSAPEFVRHVADSPIHGPGLAAFKAARAENRPTMLITGHFGNYAAARVALQARGHEVGGLYRRMANPYFNDRYVERFHQMGEPMFEQGRRGMMEMVRHLRGGGIIAIVSDLHALDGKRLAFFGKPAASSVLNAELALKYDAVMIPIYGVRQPDGLSFDIEMHAPIPHSDPETMTQALNDDLEAMVRRHMGQWFWIHRRWKLIETG